MSSHTTFSGIFNLLRRNPCPVIGDLQLPSAIRTPARKYVCPLTAKGSIFILCVLDPAQHISEDAICLC